ncbi:hypothetical protein CPC08DRAFT_729333 [Agrocybe pediades]|nr:hypothetical protein CPC08DRAFT_729333 [Agrocybe pediades]
MFLSCCIDLSSNFLSFFKIYLIWREFVERDLTSLIPPGSDDFPASGPRNTLVAEDTNNGVWVTIVRKIGDGGSLRTFLSFIIERRMSSGIRQKCAGVVSVGSVTSCERESSRLAAGHGQYRYRFYCSLVEYVVDAELFRFAMRGFEAAWTSNSAATSERDFVTVEDLIVYCGSGTDGDLAVSTPKTRRYRL